MSESLRNDGRIWVPERQETIGPRTRSPKLSVTISSSASIPHSETSCPATSPRATPKTQIDREKGVGHSTTGVYLDFADAIGRLGEDTIRERYGNLFDIYERITDENPYQVPMRIYPAVHYTMGGVWVDYNLMTTVPGLYALGEANFSDHGANRLGASALMQGLADGYFVLPYTIGDYLADSLGDPPLSTDHAAFVETKAEVEDRINGLLSIKGTRTVDFFHRELGKIMWDNCGMARNESGLREGPE